MKIAYQSGYLPVSGGHEVYWERHGREGEQPVFFLHGGPGGCSSHDHLAFFDLEHFDIVLFDQRGGGRSRPHGERQNNDTARVVEDIEALRQHFDFAQISLLGVSWGSWLALQYARWATSRVNRMVLASLFVPCPQHVATYHQALTRYLHTQESTSFEQLCLDLGRPCQALAQRAAMAWARAGLRLNRQYLDPVALERFIDAAALRAIAVELHYHQAGYFFTEQDQALPLSTPCQVIQGIDDPIGLASLRWLRQRIPLSCRLLRAGHDTFSPVLLNAIRQSLMPIQGTQ
ncbi:alpha/beta fold hydrolase [Pseudomonas nabeulensis]|uniref:Proline iminopeptidase n=1 Tax=Pseudomonas nabeulensis TaxID=2293833 RepID=A0A4Z0B468_9PSED|nr:alpha/beta fold hydrolase [Pseudomonas nabeulensis]TFY93511.1 alpha/beta fold hydrolase [Pseudomonas nabeulensis]